MTLTVSEDGQVTLPREVLDHFGVGPGEQITLDLLSNKQGTLHADTSVKTYDSSNERTVSSFIGMFKTDKQVSIEEMNETIAKGWAGLLDDDDD